MAAKHNAEGRAQRDGRRSDDELWKGCCTVLRYAPLVLRRWDADPTRRSIPREQIRNGSLVKYDSGPNDPKRFMTSRQGSAALRGGAWILLHVEIQGAAARNFRCACWVSVLLGQYSRPVAAWRYWSAMGGAVLKASTGEVRHPRHLQYPVLKVCGGDEALRAATTPSTSLATRHDGVAQRERR